MFFVGLLQLAQSAVVVSQGSVNDGELVRRDVALFAVGAHIVEHILSVPEAAGGGVQMSQRRQPGQTVRKTGRFLELFLGLAGQSLLLINQAKQFVGGREVGIHCEISMQLLDSARILAGEEQELGIMRAAG